MNTVLHLNQLGALYLDGQQTRQIDSVWVPSTQLSCFQLPKLTAPQGSWSEIIPWQLEDSLLNEPDSYHIKWRHSNALGTSVLDKGVEVLVIPKDTLEKWLVVVNDKDIRPTHLIPDCFAVEVNLQGWSAYFDESLFVKKQVIVRTSDQQGFSIDLDFFWQLVKRQLSSEPNFSLSLNYADSINLPTDSDIQQAVNDGRIIARQHQIIWQQIQPPTEFNLYDARLANVNGEQTLKRWRRTMLLGACLLIVIFAWLSLSASHYKKSADSLSKAVSADYQRMFERPLLKPEVPLASYSNQSTERQVSDSTVMLQDVDRLVSGCSECVIHSLEIDSGRLSLQLAGPQDLAEKAGRLFGEKRLVINGDQAQGYAITLMAAEQGNE